jgi:predicted enzyme related to lactoylglutathione lyase
MANHICHFEFMCNDVPKAKEFYGKIFDWSFEDTVEPMPYTMIRTGTAPEGGMMVVPPEAPMPALNVYFEVDNVTATLEKATQAGGQVMVPATEIPQIGTMGFFADPDGIVVAVFQHLKK